jgi:biopolymer transport protein ExbD
VSSSRLRSRRDAQKRRSRPRTLNLVAMIDFFTVLVFFLLVNTADPEILTPTPGIRLPDSIADAKPEERFVISVGRETLLVDGKPVATIAALEGGPDDVIRPLEAALTEHAALAPEVPEGGRSVTIMGDREIPYSLLKRIILTCQTTDFARISLGVTPTGGATG